MDKLTELANSIKANIDVLIEKKDTQAIEYLERVQDMPDWLRLKNEEPRIILLAMDIWLDAVLWTLRRKE
jgi:hypothetical protein